MLTCPLSQSTGQRHWKTWIIRFTPKCNKKVRVPNFQLTLPEFSIRQAGSDIKFTMSPRLLVPPSKILCDKIWSPQNLLLQPPSPMRVSGCPSHMARVAGEWCENAFSFSSPYLHKLSRKQLSCWRTLLWHSFYANIAAKPLSLFILNNMLVLLGLLAVQSCT